MTKILVCSDTHQWTKPLRQIINREEPDLIFHLGDMLSDLPEAIGVIGNCDWMPGDLERVEEVEGLRFFLCHGHRLGVKYSLDTLWARAKQEKADVALFGHTHRRHQEKREGIHLFNPGSLTYPKDSHASYLLFYVEDGHYSWDFVLL